MCDKSVSSYVSIRRYKMEIVAILLLVIGFLFTIVGVNTDSIPILLGSILFYMCCVILVVVGGARKEA